jgi:ribosomal protein L37AE/L43A
MRKLPPRPRTGRRHQSQQSARHREQSQHVCAGCGATGPLVHRRNAWWCTSCDPNGAPAGPAGDEEAAA